MKRASAGLFVLLGFLPESDRNIYSFINVDVGQFIRILINFTGPEINDHISFQ